MQAVISDVCLACDHQVALWACEYARERRLFEETFFVSLQEEGMGAPITALKDVSARIARAFGISEKVPPDPFCAVTYSAAVVAVVAAAVVAAAVAAAAVSPGLASLITLCFDFIGTYHSRLQ